MAFATLTIDLEKIKSNITTIKTSLPNGTDILLAAKANAYGLGAIEICKHLDTTIDFIGVANITEAMELRNANIKTPILMLTEPFQDDLPLVAAHDISITVFQHETLKKLEKYTTNHPCKIKTHFKIDTGMSRLGHYWQTSSEEIKHWLNLPSTIIKEGFYTHIANSETKGHHLNTLQIKRFNSISKSLIPSDEIIQHCANSGAIDNIENSNYNLVRVGLKAYEHSFTLTAPIQSIKHVPENTPVGYGSEYTSSEPIIIGVIGMGYADGLPSQIAANGYVVINNNKCNIIGRVCMDMFMVKIPKGAMIKSSDKATIIASSPTDGMTIHSIAKDTNANPREIMTRLSHRIQRDWIKTN